MPQAVNQIDLDPNVKNINGLPVARITYSPHQHELTAQEFYIPQIVALLKAAGADVAGAVSAVTTDTIVVAQGDVPTNKHIMGGMRMGADPATSVCDEFGRVRTLDNVFVTDAGVFVNAGHGRRARPHGRGRRSCCRRRRSRAPRLGRAPAAMTPTYIGFSRRYL